MDRNTIETIINISVSLLGVLGLIRFYYVENYLRLLQKKQKVNFIVFFKNIKIPDDGLKYFLIIPFYRKNNGNYLVEKFRKLINIVTFAIYVIILINTIIVLKYH